MTPAVVVISSHNSARFTKRTLSAIDSSMGARPYALVWVDDASTDNTVELARTTVCRARERVTLKMPRAGSISAAKNRALRLALPLLRQYPWVLQMDDDDEMMPGRSALIDRMEEEGQLAGIGDWVYTPTVAPDKATRMQGDSSLYTGQYAPGTTVLHRDIIPKGGFFFAEVGPVAVEDMVAHRQLALRGIPWCYHRGAPVHNYHNRADSYLGVGDKASARIKAAYAHIDEHFPETRTSINSFGTLAFGNVAVEEARLLIYSIRVTGNRQPIRVYTDAPGKVALAGMVEDLDVVDLEKEFGTRVPKFSGVPRASRDPAALAAYSFKMDVLADCAERWGSCLFLDGDVVVLRKYLDVFDTPMALTPELPGRGIARDGLTWGHQSSGYWNASCVYAHRDGLSLVGAWRKDYEAGWMKYRGGTASGMHGHFCDQSSLELLPLLSEVTSLHPGHSFFAPQVQPYGAYVDDESGLFQAGGVTAGAGLYARGWPVMSIHCHWRSDNWHRHGPAYFRKLMARCWDRETKDVLQMVYDPRLQAPNI